ncbi:hypothetical protein [Wolbachia endosymbiont of Aedes albopictus]|uniref:hypothetical protein n=1 Tax=Wolbachia endosymbiont of Aedes albopictus TaxID=167957 RepID=UPI00216A33BF|nr:hypothetical protein [Wolbachia endosymbiont of Aedes albopictus]UVW84317.1 hypothetical protein NHG98_02310 [Wolbachia endosymbiont of Aedes albopictus]
MMLSSQCPDTGIQKSLLVSKQTSIESGYNIFDEIIWKTGFQTGMTSSRRHPRHPATVSLDPANT